MQDKTTNIDVTTKETSTSPANPQPIRHAFIKGDDYLFEENDTDSAKLSEIELYGSEICNNILINSALNQLCLNDSSIENCSFKDTEISSLGMESTSWRDNQISASKFSKLGFEGGQMDDCQILASELTDVIIAEDCDLQDLTLNKSHVISSDILASSFRKCRIENSRVESCSFESMTLSGVEWVDSNLVECGFRNFELKDLKIAGLNLRDQIFEDLDSFLNVLEKTQQV